MIIRSLSIRDLRIHRRIEIEFPDTGLVFVGKNGVGKTSVLEAIHCAAVGRSFRRVPDDELIRTGCDSLEVIAEFMWRGEDHRIEFRVVSGLGKKMYMDGQVVHRLGELVELTRVVTTSGDDVLLVEGSPMYGRRWLDLLTCQIEAGHVARLIRYNHVLKQRNRLLSNARDGYTTSEKTELDPWTDQLFQIAHEIEQRRIELITRIGDRVQEFYSMVSDDSRSLAAGYRPGLKPDTTREDLKRYERTEYSRGYTLWGPQRGILHFDLDGLSARSYASRGEKRSISFALKLAQSQIVDERPICLLDDLSQELDERRSSKVLELFMEHGQVIVSSTRPVRLEDTELQSITLGREENSEEQ